MQIQAIKTNGIQFGIDFDAHYQVKGYRGIAFYLIGWAVEVHPTICYGTDPDTGEEIEIEDYSEPEFCANHETVVAVMVGDDRRHSVDIGDLIPLAPDKFCRSCGQVGCGCNVYV